MRNFSLPTTCQENIQLNENSKIDAETLCYGSSSSLAKFKSPIKSKDQQMNTQNLFSLSALVNEEGTFSQIFSLLIGLLLIGSSIALIVQTFYVQTVDTESVRYGWVELLSLAIGYTYTLSWSLGPMPQAFLNFKRKSTVGVSIDSYMLQLLATGCYSIYNVGMFYSRKVQILYSDRHGGERNRVDGNDVVFALYSFLMTCFILSQILYYGHQNKERNEERDKKTGLVPSKSSICMVAFVVFGAIIYVASIMVFESLEKSVQPPKYLNWLDFCYALSSAKIVIVLLKYIPQVVLNFQRHSTSGWSIFTVFLDVNGGILSMLQLFLDCWNHYDWGGILGNLAKFMLGFVSLVFDMIFIVQHYVLFTPSSLKIHPNNDSESNSLLITDRL